jgi:uncharacterized membrane protein YdjX (TVP38/TMEM64 family)
VKEAVLNLFHQQPQLALFISLCLSVLIAVIGILPSFFITAANIIFFGFWEGILVSFLGEAIGAIVAFVLYRRGFKKNISAQLQKFPRAQRLINAEGKEAFMLVLSLRLIPFVPSGLVTFAAAVGRILLPTFILSSSLGKIPALLLEGYSVYQVTQFNWQGKIILFVFALVLIYYAIKKIRS